jgi:hypothetical protein
MQLVAKHPIHPITNSAKLLLLMLLMLLVLPPPLLLLTLVLPPFPSDRQPHSTLGLSLCRALEGCICR